MRNRRVRLKEQFGPTCRRLREMCDVVRWEPGDPVQPSDGCTFGEVKKVQASANRQMPDSRMRLHYESLRKSPSASDSACVVNLVLKRMRKHNATQPPGQKDHESLQ